MKRKPSSYIVFLEESEKADKWDAIGSVSEVWKWQSDVQLAISSLPFINKEVIYCTIDNYNTKRKNIIITFIKN